MKQQITTFILFVFVCTGTVVAQKKSASLDSDGLLIQKILHEQDQAWNRGDLEAFMQTYWKSDSLMFIGKSGPTYGWKNTLNNYKRGYPDTAAMGKLHFELIRLQRLSPEYYFVAGKWFLTRTIGNLQGDFTLLLRKINGRWYIVTDHSS